MTHNWKTYTYAKDPESAPMPVRRRYLSAPFT
jgi:hypothetical protein